MAKQSVVDAAALLKKTPWQRFVINFKRNWQLNLMLVAAIVYVLLFDYAPMFGLQIAFRDYRTRAGIFNSEWVGLRQFYGFFRNYKWSYYVLNTFKIASYGIFAGFPVPIFLAVMLHINEHKGLKKVTQNISYVPHFISTVVMVGVLNRIFDPLTGIYGTIAKMAGVNDITDLRANPDAFIHLFVWSGIWQGMGWSAIIYISALSAVSPELHEAARIDGASRWRRVWAVDLPAITPTICILLIQRMGGILGVGYEKIYLMQNTLNLTKSEVISTYVYKTGLANNRMSYGSAVGLMNSAISSTMIIITNWVVNKLSDNEFGLF